MSGFVTRIATAPDAAWTGVVAVIVVALTTVTLVAAVPSRATVAPVTKPVTVIVIAVPPATLPEEGARLVTDGAAAAV